MTSTLVRLIGDAGAELPVGRQGGPSVGSHKPGGDGPGAKKFKHEPDDDKRKQKWFADCRNPVAEMIAQSGA